MRPTTVFSTAALASTFVYSLLSTSQLPQVKNLDRALLGVATAQYLITAPLPDNQIQSWRYLDWIVTTPLLLKTFHSLAQVWGWPEGFRTALTFNMIMIVAGYFAEYPELSPFKITKTDGDFNKSATRNLWYVVSSLALLVIFQEVAKWDQLLRERGVNTKSVPYFFYLGWTAYALNFFTPVESTRQNVFDVLDVVNKAVYTLALDDVIATMPKPQ